MKILTEAKISRKDWKWVGRYDIMSPDIISCSIGNTVLHESTKVMLPIEQKILRGMRTRRSGRWLPRQPRLGARMCQRHILFYIIGNILMEFPIA